MEKFLPSLCSAHRTDEVQANLLTDSCVLWKDNAPPLFTLTEAVIGQELRQHSSAPHIVPIHDLRCILGAKVMCL